MEKKFLKKLVYAAAAVAVFFAGAQQCTAQEWVALKTGLTDTFSAIWGSSPHDMYIAANSGVYGGNGRTWEGSMAGGPQRGIWGFSGSDIFAVGDGGSISHYDGRSWERFETGAAENLNGVWGPDPKRVFAVGDAGLVLVYNGTSWVEQPRITTATLRSVWGNDYEDVYVVGDGGVILNFNGAEWRTMQSPSSQDLYAVWGCGCYNIYAAGNGGTVLAYDRQAWRAIPGITGEDLRSIWNADEQHTYVAGTSGTIIHLDVNWSGTLMPSGVTGTLNHLWGFSDDDLYAVGDGGQVLHYSKSGASSADHTMRVIPSKINKLVNRLFPFHLLLLIGDEETSFTSADARSLAWDSVEIATFAKLRFGSRLILALVFVSPFISSGYYEITVGNCVGTLKVQQLLFKADGYVPQPTRRCPK